MKKAAAHPTTKSPRGNSDDHFSLGSLAADFLDTAWRIAVPVVICAGLGIFLDIQLGSKPWLTLAGTVVGFVLAFLLIKQQLGIIAGGDEDN